MKRLFLLLFLLFTISIAAFTQQYDIRLNLTPGTTVPFKKQSNVDIKVRIPFFGVGHYKRSSVTNFSFTVLEKKGENYILECIASSEEITQNLRIEKAKKRKSKKDIEEEEEIKKSLEKAFKDNDKQALKINQSVQVEVTPLFEQVGKTVRPDTAALSQEDANRISNLLDVFAEVFPKKPVSVGEKWILEEEDGLTVTARLSAVSNESYTIINNAEMKMNMGIAKASGKGALKNEIERHTGLLKRNETRFPFKGSVWILLLRIRMEGTVTSVCEIMQ